MQSNFTFNRHRIRLSGYTLLEMVVASASAVILIGGLSSSLFIATQSLDVSSGSLAEARTAQEIIARINSDLQSAVSLSELTTTAVTMNVPDRNGDNVPEVIRYSWSGTTSDPLQITYNGTTSDLAADVQAFSFTWISRLIRGQTAFPIVLFVSSQTPAAAGDGIAIPTSTEQERIDLMHGWGYDVTVLSQQATQEQFDAEIANSTVVYVSGECNGATIGTKLNATTIGVVTESYDNSENLGFYTLLLNGDTAQTEVEITSIPHYITETLSTGTVTVASSNQQMKWTASVRAPDSVSLATVAPLLIVQYPTLLVLDAGDELADGGTAAGRRCQLPWGESSFDVTTLTTDGQTIMQRSLEWAAGTGGDTEALPGSVIFEEFTEAKQTSSSNDITVAVPTGTTENNLLIATVVTDGSIGTNLSPPSGWSEISLGTDSDDRVTLGIWWRLASSSEPADYTWSWTANGETSYAWIMRFTGHNGANPIHAFVEQQGSGTSSSPDSPAITTSTDGCMILRIGGFDDDDINVDDAGVSNHTTITCDETSASTTSCSGAAAYANQESAGSAGSEQFSLTRSEQWRCVTIAIEPDPNN